VRPYLAGPKALERAIAHYYGRGFGAVSTSRAGGSGGAGVGMATGVIDFDPSDMNKPMEVIRGSGAAHEMPKLAGTVDIGLPTPRQGREAEIQALQERISKLEALVARDEDVLRKLLGLLVEKGVASREEILERIR
jgi:hypothetical protein